MTPEQNRELLKYVEKAVRAELCIRSIELKDREMSYGYQIENVGVAAIYGEFMKKLDINGNTRVSDKKIINMPSAVKGTYSLWLSNHDVRSLVSRATFYRHKKILREEYGINIDKPTREIGSNVVSINKVMELEPLACPEFLVASNLVILKRAG
jgi:II/X family phage/plasmid replication protein